LDFYLPEFTKSLDQKKKILLDISQYWRGLARLAHIGLYDSQAAQSGQTSNNAGKQSHLFKRGVLGIIQKEGYSRDAKWMM
jgi:hypothetical protein